MSAKSPGRTMTPTESVQSILGPMTSPAKVEAVIVAVLEAIREPSEGMAVEGAIALGAHPNEWRLVRDAFTAMIDHLLEERAKGGGR